MGANVCLGTPTYTTYLEEKERKRRVSEDTCESKEHAKEISKLVVDGMLCDYFNNSRTAQQHELLLQAELLTKRYV